VTTPGEAGVSIVPSQLRPRAWRAWRQRRRFLSQFVRSGDLVFDVGANRGEYAVTFQQLGCRVVAIEPNPELARRIPGVVEQVAVSDGPGETALLVGDRDEEATIDPDYAALLRSRGQQLNQVRVPVTSLDLLATKHGRPAFVKIDVEGHELAALKGMSFSPPRLSIEYHPTLADTAHECLRLLEERGYRFRGTVGFGNAWRTELTDPAGIMRLIRLVEEENPLLFGDVYAFHQS